jgi:hypothetical protein
MTRNTSTLSMFSRRIRAESSGVGGQGIHFLRHFADKLEYELTPTGNRLRIAISAANSAL